MVLHQTLIRAQSPHLYEWSGGWVASSLPLSSSRKSLITSHSLPKEPKEQPNREAVKDDSTKLCVCRIFYLLGVMQSLEQTQVLQNNPVLKMSDLSVS